MLYGMDLSLLRRHQNGEVLYLVRTRYPNAGKVFKIIEAKEVTKFSRSHLKIKAKNVDDKTVSFEFSQYQYDIKTEKEAVTTSITDYIGQELLVNDYVYVGRGEQQFFGFITKIHFDRADIKVLKKTMDTKTETISYPGHQCIKVMPDAATLYLLAGDL